MEDPTMRRLPLLAFALSLPLLGACAKYWDMAESGLASITPPPEAAGPAARWVPADGGRRVVGDGPDFHAAFARCRWMAEQGMLEPVDARDPGPRILTPSDTVPPGPMRPIPQERVGERGPSDWWPTEARLAPCMRAAGFVPAAVPQRRF
jgi:hypothetical protein